MQVTDGMRASFTYYDTCILSNIFVKVESCVDVIQCNMLPAKVSFLEANDNILDIATLCFLDRSIYSLLWLKKLRHGITHSIMATLLLFNCVWHYGEVKWMLSQHKLKSMPMFIQQRVRTNGRENMKAPLHRPFMRKVTGLQRRICSRKDQ